MATAKHNVVVARKRTVKVRQSVSNEANIINARLQQVAIIHNELLDEPVEALAGAVGQVARAPRCPQRRSKPQIKESQAISAASAAIEAKIRASEAAGSIGGHAGGDAERGRASSGR